MRELEAIVGAEFVAPPGAAELADATEWSFLRGHAAAVVRPGSAEEVAAVVAWCYEHDVPVTPRGGGTGWAGGAVPAGGIVLALERLDRVRAFDPAWWRMEVDAGVTTATVARRAREAGLYYPVDPGAAETSQIGGNLATNAGGPHALKYGVTRAWVLGVEAVLAPGELVRVGGPVRKDVAGYDLTSLLVGSEGTLGVITGAWLRLVPAPEAAASLALSCATAADAGAAMERVLTSGVVPAALEYLDAGAVAAAPGGPADDVRGVLLLVDVDGTVEEVARARAEVREALGAGAIDVADRGALWRWRDGIGIAVAAQRGGKLSEDIAVPADRLAEAIDETLVIGARHDLDACSWGHAGDGNLHSTFMLDASDPAQRAKADAAAAELFALARRLGGTVSGEHGIGRLKDGQLREQWAPAAVAAHEAIKRALDPKGLLNPGVKRP
ncbi:MAG: FAD-binding protein [Solirubrobacteraceae bacterium]|nr:FAD-binding protein [Solirubrobacteraceae bacterium]